MSHSTYTVRPRRAVLIIMMLIAIGVCSYRVWMVTRIKEQLTRLERSGKPTSFAKWATRFPDVPYKENAALVYLSAFSKLGVTNRSSLWQICRELADADPTEKLQGENRVAVTNALFRNKGAIEAIKKVPETLKSRYPVALTKGARVKLGDLQDVDTAGVILALDAAIHTDDGNANMAAESIKTLLTLSRSLKGEPLLILQEVRYRWNTHAFYALQRLLLQCRLEESELEKLQHRFSEAGELTDLVPALDGERCHGIVANPRTIAREFGGVNEQPLSGMLWACLRMSGRYEADRLMFLQTMDQWTAVAGKPYPERFVDAQAFHDEAYAKAKSGACFLSAGFTIAIAPAFRFEAENVARMRVAETAIAALRYKQKTGSLPQRIADLSPDFQSVEKFDPFDGKPLKLKTDENVLTIYSIGKDLEDNGGRVQGQQTYQSLFDLPFRIPGN
jgi:hypothetical protein